MLELFEFLLAYGAPSGAIAAGFVHLLRSRGLMVQSHARAEQAEAVAEESRATAAAAEQGRRDALAYAQSVMAETREKVDLGQDVHQVEEGVEALAGQVQAVLDLLRDRAGAEAPEAGGEGLREEVRQEIRALRDLLGQQTQAQAVTQMTETLSVSKRLDQLREELAGHALSAGEVDVLRGLLAELAAEDRGRRGPGQHRRRPGLVVLPGAEQEDKPA